MCVQAKAFILWGGNRGRVPLAVVDTFGVDIDTEKEWELSDIRPFGSIHAHSSLQSDLGAIQERYVQYSIEYSSVTAIVLMLGLHSLNTLDERVELLA